MNRRSKGMVFNIQRLSVHDGPGIRTTVFLKGCPLNCLWCHNPESKSPLPELSFSRTLCTDCGRCESVCSVCCHAMKNGRHTFDRESCILCGECVKVCTGALEMIGRATDCAEVMTQVLKDRNFYKNSGGGITISGGEPLYQFAYTKELLVASKENDLHTCVETSGFSDYTNLADILEYVDLFLYDWKESNEEWHEKFTGVSNRKIYKNLFRLDDAGAKIILRCPIIPGYNDRDEHFAGIADIANRLKNIQQIDIEPYNPMGIPKCENIGRTYTGPPIAFSKENEIPLWIEKIRRETKVRIKRS